MHTCRASTGHGDLYLDACFVPVATVAPCASLHVASSMMTSASAWATGISSGSVGSFARGAVSVLAAPDYSIFEKFRSIEDSSLIMISSTCVPALPRSRNEHRHHHLHRRDFVYRAGHSITAAARSLSHFGLGCGTESIDAAKFWSLRRARMCATCRSNAFCGFLGTDWLLHSFRTVASVHCIVT